jgi:hypothetical protein
VEADREHIIVNHEWVENIALDSPMLRLLKKQLRLGSDRLFNDFSCEAETVLKIFGKTVSSSFS